MGAEVGRSARLALHGVGTCAYVADGSPRSGYWERFCWGPGRRAPSDRTARCRLTLVVLVPGCRILLYRGDERIPSSIPLVRDRACSDQNQEAQVHVRPKLRERANGLVRSSSRGERPALHLPDPISQEQKSKKRQGRDATLHYAQLQRQMFKRAGKRTHQCPVS